MVFHWWLYFDDQSHLCKDQLMDKILFKFPFPPSKSDILTISRGDMDRLEPGCYLNDIIIDYYLRFLARPTSLSKANWPMLWPSDVYYATSMLRMRHFKTLCSYLVRTFTQCSEQKLQVHHQKKSTPATKMSRRGTISTNCSSPLSCLYRFMKSTLYPAQYLRFIPV